jgi:salicylate hydroxylase
LSVTVFEQAGELRKIGAGVSIFPNATRLLQRIGLTDEIEKIGSPITGLVMRTSVGEVISSSTTPSTGIRSYNVNRAEFLKLLADAQPEGTLHLGYRLSEARDTNDRVRLTFSNGAIVNSDVVIRGSSGRARYKL